MGLFQTASCVKVNLNRTANCDQCEGNDKPFCIIDCEIKLEWVDKFCYKLQHGFGT